MTKEKNVLLRNPQTGSEPPAMGSLEQSSRSPDAPNPPRRRDSSAGFTLLEIMIVLAIIALVAGGVGTAVFRSFNNAKRQAAKLRLKSVRDATAQFMIDNNSSCPKGIEDLLAQKYLDKNNAKDPWDKPFFFRCPGTNDPDSADVSSSGPDKQEGTPDDIKSWEL